MSGKAVLSGRFLTPVGAARRCNILTVTSVLFYLRNCMLRSDIIQFMPTKRSAIWLLDVGSCSPAAFDLKLPLTRWELTNAVGLCCVTWRHTEIPPQYRSPLQQRGVNADYLEMVVPPRVTRLQRGVKRCDVPSLAAVSCRNEELLSTTHVLIYVVFLRDVPGNTAQRWLHSKLQGTHAGSMTNLSC